MNKLLDIYVKNGMYGGQAPTEEQLLEYLKTVHGLDYTDVEIRTNIDLYKAITWVQVYCDDVILTMKLPIDACCIPFYRYYNECKQDRYLGYAGIKDNEYIKSIPYDNIEVLGCEVVFRYKNGLPIYIGCKDRREAEELLTYIQKGNNKTLGLVDDFNNDRPIYTGFLPDDNIVEKQQTPTDKMLEEIEELYKNNLEIIQQKNSDYANSSDDPLRNFKAVEKLGICSTETGMLVRMTDKFMRIINLIEKLQNGDKEAVKDETIQDTISDFINYLALLYCKLNEESE